MSCDNNNSSDMDFECQQHASRTVSDVRVDAPLDCPAEPALDSNGESGSEQISRNLDEVRKLAESFFEAFGEKSETVSNDKCEQVVHAGRGYEMLFGNGWDVRSTLPGST